MVAAEVPGVTDAVKVADNHRIAPAPGAARRLRKSPALGVRGRTWVAQRVWTLGLSALIWGS